MHIDGSSQCDDPVKVRRDGHAEQGRQRRARVRMAEVKGAEGGSAGRKTSGLGKSYTRADHEQKARRVRHRVSRGAVHTRCCAGPDGVFVKEEQTNTTFGL